jgi:saccharopine dehydrogenase (NAD+, L-lysine-forming)
MLLSDWMIYGANGYTGALVAEEAAARGARPILAGRSEGAIAPLAARLGCDHRIFDLDDAGAAARHLDGARAVLLCAGPFSRTSRPMVDACLARGVHYLDITGEIPVFEAVHARTGEATRAGVVLLPGVGFDVVPSDCLAATLAAALPGASELALAFSGGSPSAGTAKTMLEGLPRGGAARRGGRIVRVPVAWKTADIPFADRTRPAVTIPWGDVATAFHSTGIPDIETYVAQPRRAIRALRLARPFFPLLGLRPVQRLAARAIEKRVAGPDAEARERGRSQLWGRVRDPAGNEVQGTATVPEGYRFTVLSALASVERLLAGGVAPRAHTPSTAFGADFVTTIEGCTLRVGEPTRASSAA